MYHRSVISIFVLALSFISLSAQTPEPKAEKDSPFGKSFAFSMFDGNSSYLGVQTSEVTNANFAKLGLREVRGVAVEKVVEGSPAAAAGLKSGDVIVRFNGDEVTSGRKLSRLVGEVSPDHKVKITVLRGGAEQEIIATIGKSPAPTFENGNFRFRVPQGDHEMDLGQLKNLDRLREIPKMDNFKMPDLENFKMDLPRTFNLTDG